jgi:hypothetical protein
MPDSELKNVTIGPMLKGMVRGRLAATYTNETPETLEHTTDLLLPHVSLDALGELRFDNGAASIAPRLVAAEMREGNDDDAKIHRADAITRRLAPLPNAPSGDNAKDLIRGLPPLRANASDEERIRRANEIISIMQRSGHREEDPNGY